MSFESSFSWAVYLCLSFFASLGIEQNVPFNRGINNLVRIDFFPEFHLEIGEWSLQEMVGLTSFGFVLTILR